MIYVIYNGAYSGPQVDAAVSRALAGGAIDQAIEALQASVGSPLTAATAADMTDKSKVYVYAGSEAGYTAGDWYFWDGAAWTSGGVYNAVAVDMALDDSSNNAVANRIVKAAIDANTGAIEAVSETAAYGLAAFPAETDAGAVAHTGVGADGVPIKALLADVALTQSGSGDPAPDNVRPISVFSGLTVTHDHGGDSDTYNVSWLTEAGEIPCGTLDVATGTLTLTHDFAIGNAAGGLDYYHGGVKVLEPSISANAGYAYFSIGTSIDHSTAGNSMCDRLKYVSGNSVASVVNTFTVRTSSNYHRLTFIADIPGWGTTAAEHVSAVTTYLAAQYAADTPMQVAIALVTPVVVQLDPVAIKTALGGNDVSVDTGDVAVTFRCDPALYFQQLLGGE